MIGVFPKSSPWRFVTSAPSGLDEIVSPLDEQALRRAKHAKEIPIAQEELLLLLSFAEELSSYYSSTYLTLKVTYACRSKL